MNTYAVTRAKNGRLGLSMVPKDVSELIDPIKVLSRDLTGGTEFRMLSKEEYEYIVSIGINIIKPSSIEFTHKAGYETSFSKADAEKLKR